MLGPAILLMAAAPAALPPPRWGTANAANLAAMARPADLAQPAPPGPASPASGALEAAAVARLLAGKPKDLMRENAAQAGGTGTPR
jgi:hypothetical protein